MLVCRFVCVRCMWVIHFHSLCYFCLLPYLLVYFCFHFHIFLVKPFRRFFSICLTVVYRTSTRWIHRAYENFHLFHPFTIDSHSFEFIHKQCISMIPAAVNVLKFVLWNIFFSCCFFIRFGLFFPFTGFCSQFSCALDFKQQNHRK